MKISDFQFKIPQNCESVKYPNSYLSSTPVSFLFEPDNHAFTKGISKNSKITLADIKKSYWAKNSEQNCKNRYFEESCEFRSVKTGHVDSVGNQHQIPFPIFYDEWNIISDQPVSIENCPNANIFAESFDETRAKDKSIPLQFEVTVELASQIIAESHHMFYKLIKFSKNSIPEDKPTEFYRTLPGTPAGSLSHPILQEGYQRITHHGNYFSIQIDPACEYSDVLNPEKCRKLSKKHIDECLFDQATETRHYLFWMVVLDDLGVEMFEKYFIFSRPDILGCEKLEFNWPKNE